MPAAATSGRAELVKQGVAEGLQRESGRQVDSVGETHETGGVLHHLVTMHLRRWLTLAGLEKVEEQNLEQHLRLRAPQTWVV